MNIVIDRRPTADHRQLVFHGTQSVVGRPALYLAFSTLIVSAYLLFAQLQNGEFGFPLDDAWIHQVYARNLGTRGEFAFFPGQLTAGSTSPLWTTFISVGYALRIDFRVWTVGLGILLLALSAMLGAQLARRLGASTLVADWLVPFFIIGEWHLAWAAVSGMEILLFIALSLALVELFLAEQHAFWTGLMAGLLTLTRPEGAVLAVLVAAGSGLHRLFASGASHPPATFKPSTPQVARGLRPFKPSTLQLATFALGFVLPLLPYAAFNLYTSGTLLPNTFYAKSQEYAELLSRANFVVRWLSLYKQPLIGAQILLLPGVLWLAVQLARGRRWSLLIPLAWTALLPALYAARLPVDYQFGRYEMPIIPFLGIYGIVGMAELLARIRLRVIRRAWAMTVAVLALAFAWLSVNQYARSAAIINCEMVATAKWTAANLPAGALIAAHDIGAQGYLDSHPMLDMAGLVSPEVIPFIRDESHLLEWMKARGASYAIFFPDWYPKLARDASLVPVHAESCGATHAAGEVDLVVYKVAR